jgi:O-antigen ligase
MTSVPATDPTQSRRDGSTTGPGIVNRTPWLFGVLVLLTSLIYFPAAINPLENFDPPKRLCWIMGILWMFLQGIRSTRGQLAVSKPILLVTVLAGWMVTRTALRPHPWAEAGILCVWLLPLAAFIAGYVYRSRRYSLRSLRPWLIVALVIQIALMLAQRFNLDPLFGSTTSMMPSPAWRMVGSIGYQNQAAAFVALCGLVVAATSGRLLHSAGILAVCLIVVFSTGSRGAAISLSAATIAGLLVSLAIEGRQRKSRSYAPAWIYVLVTVICICSLMLAVPTIRQRLTAVADLSDPGSGLGPRFILNRVGLQIASEHPLLGSGAGEFALQYLDRLGDLLPSKKDHRLLGNVAFARETHNDYLQFAAEFGLLALLLVAGIIYLFFRNVRSQSSVERIPSKAGVCVFTYMAVHSLVSFPWQMAMSGPLAGLLLGLCISQDSGSRSPPRRYREFAATGVWILLMLAVLIWSISEALLTLRVPAVVNQRDAVSLSHKLSTFAPWAHRHQALLGSILAKQGAFNDAKNILQLADQGYRDPVLLNNLGHTYSKLGDWSAALDIYQRWADTGIEHQEALANVATAYENLFRYSEVADTLILQSQLWPTIDQAYHLRILVMLMRAQHFEEGIAYANTFKLKLRQNNKTTSSEIENVRGLLLWSLGRHEKAAAAFKEALIRNPELTSAIKNLELLNNSAQPEAIPLNTAPQATPGPSAIQK